MVSKGKEDLQIMSAACAVTLLAALRAAFMLPQQREGLPRVCNVPFRMLRAGSGGDRADMGRRLDEDAECMGKCRKTNTSCNSQRH